MEILQNCFPLVERMKLILLARGDHVIFMCLEQSQHMIRKKVLALKNTLNIVSG